MTKPFLVKFEEEMLAGLRSRAELDQMPVAQVIKKAVEVYLAKGVRAPATIEPAGALVKDGRCDCGHLERVHTNTAVSSGTGCNSMGCSCRRFRAEG